MKECREAYEYYLKLVREEIKSKPHLTAQQAPAANQAGTAQGNVDAASTTVDNANGATPNSQRVTDTANNNSFFMKHAERIIFGLISVVVVLLAALLYQSTKHLLD